MTTIETRIEKLEARLRTRYPEPVHFLITIVDRVDDDGCFEPVEVRLDGESIATREAGESVAAFKARVNEIVG